MPHFSLAAIGHCLITPTVLEQRRGKPTDKKDMLNAMLNHKRSGMSLSDDSVIDNVSHSGREVLFAF
jgi:hypothetical protein